MSKFVKIGELRVTRSSVKKYADVTSGISVNFTSSTNMYQTEIIRFENISDKIQCLQYLDDTYDGEIVHMFEKRIKLNIIKKYKPVGVKSVTLYYSTSRKNVVSETFEFVNKDWRDRKLLELDIAFGTD